MEQRTKLDPAKKARIVKALREGGYDQAYNALASNALTDKQPAQFCALGVICEEFRREHPDEVMWVATDTGCELDYEFSLVPREKYLALKERHERGEIDEYAFDIERERLDLCNGNLPAVVAQWLGMDDVCDAGTVNVHVHVGSNVRVGSINPALTPVTVLNDVRKFPLKRIADLIEQDKEL